MEKVTVYSKEDCGQCDMTKKVMDAEDVLFNEKYVDTDEEALNEVVALGYLAAPVVLVEGAENTPEHWSGFRPDLIKKLSKTALKGIVNDNIEL